MIGAILAYYIGKGAGASDERGRQPSRPMTDAERANMENAGAIIFICLLMLIAVAICT